MSNTDLTMVKGSNAGFCCSSFHDSIACHVSKFGAVARMLKPVTPVGETGCPVESAVFRTAKSSRSAKVCGSAAARQTASGGLVTQATLQRSEGAGRRRDQIKSWQTR